MPVTGGHLKVMYRYEYLGQRCENVQYWRLEGAAFLTATVLGVLEAHWDGMKTALRGLTPDSYTQARWLSLYGQEIGGGLGYAEYAIEPPEDAGARTAAAISATSPSFVAGSFRQSVGTRTTRPGQKRFPFVQEADHDGNALNASYRTLLAAVAVKFSTADVLGAPVATGVMHPEIGGTLVGGIPTVYQDVTGYVINLNVNSQVSRKIGHGN